MTKGLVTNDGIDRQKWQRVYLNLKRIKLNEKSVENENGGTLSDKLSGVIVPKNCGRKLELYNIHQIGKVAVRQPRRAMTDVVVSQSGNSVYLTVRAHMKQMCRMLF